MLARRIQRNEIGIVRTQVHSEVYIVNREAKRLRQLGKSADVFRVVQKARKAFLEIVVAWNHVEDAMISFVHLAGPGKRLTGGEHTGWFQQLRLLLGDT